MNDQINRLSPWILSSYENYWVFMLIREGCGRRGGNRKRWRGRKKWRGGDRLRLREENQQLHFAVYFLLCHWAHSWTKWNLYFEALSIVLKQYFYFQCIIWKVKDILYFHATVNSNMIHRRHMDWKAVSFM